MYMHYNHCHRATAHLQLNILLLLLLYNYQSTQLFIFNYALQRHVSTQPSHHQAILEPYLRH